MVTVNDIMQSMSRWAPLDTISEGDNVGLLVGRKNAPVKCVLTALEINSKIIDEAIEKGADMIVCHHPIIYNSDLKSIADEDYISLMIIRLIEHKIAVYAAHTNLDWAKGGVCDILADTVGIDNLESLVGNQGRIGQIKPMKLIDFAQKVKENLNCPAIKFVGDPDRIIKRVGLVSGSGGSYMDEAIKQGCDLFLSADFKYHQALKAEEVGICLIDAGHFETENGIIYSIANYLKKEYNNITVLTSDRKKSYYKYI